MIGCQIGGLRLVPAWLVFAASVSTTALAQRGRRSVIVSVACTSVTMACISVTVLWSVGMGLARRYLLTGLVEVGLD
jgi:hypothetical protein